MPTVHPVRPILALLGTWALLPVTATTYRLKAPVDGLWACKVPSGWTSTSTVVNRDCALYQPGTARKYLLSH